MEESGGFSERKGGFSACGKLGESRNCPSPKASNAFVLAVALYSGRHEVFLEYHREARRFQLLFIRGWRLFAGP